MDRLTRSQFVGWGVLCTVVTVALSAPWWAPQVMAYGPSTSLAKGWYIRAFPVRPLTHGDIVVVAVSERMTPYLPTDLPAHRLLKHVAGLTGDIVCWSKDRMTVFQADQVHTYRYHPDATSHQAYGCVALTEADLILVGLHTRSCDSRYLGVIARQLVQFRVVPVWTWEGQP